MDGYIKWVDGLGKGLKLLFAILVQPIFIVYRIFKCILAKDFGNKFVFTIIAGVIWPIGLVLDVINVCKNNAPASYWSEDGVVEAKAEDKKPEDKPADKPEEKPAEEKKEEGK
jgi:hypothetical protein